MTKYLQKVAFISMIFMGIVNYSFSQTGTVTVDQDKDIAKLLEYKKDLKTIEFYRIQIISNSSRSEAEAMESSFKSTVGKWPTEMVYEPPNYKIWVGNFRTRLEADRALQEIKNKYVNAFIFKPKKR